MKFPYKRKPPCSDFVFQQKTSLLAQVIRQEMKVNDHIGTKNVY